MLNQQIFSCWTIHLPIYQPSIARKAHYLMADKTPTIMQFHLKSVFNVFPKLYIVSIDTNIR